MAAYWLMKSEPSVYSIDHMARDGKTYWDGVRNYQARNFMRDPMKPGDLALFYHSNADPSGIAGVIKIASKGYPDPSAFDPRDIHYDPASTKEKPVWYTVDVNFVEKLRTFLPLERLRKTSGLESMALFRRSRLSVQPVAEKEWKIIRKLAASGA